MTTESQPLIDCRNVRKIFPDSAGVPFAAVDDVSFRLSAGEIVGLLGPDGAGKTTLIRLITGLMKPHGGSISVLNLDSVKKSRSIQASIGYMPQKFGLYEDLTVRENMELYARMHGVYGQDREKRFRQPALHDQPGTLHHAACGKALRRHETKTGPVLFPGLLPAPYPAGRTHRGRGSSFPAGTVEHPEAILRRGRRGCAGQHLLHGRIRLLQQNPHHV